MTLEQLILALAAGLGGSGGLVVLLRVVVPWAKRVLSVGTAISGALDASQARLIASLTAEITELSRQRDDCRDQLRAVRDEQ